MALPGLQTKLEQLDSFIIESANEVCSTMLNCEELEGRVFAKLDA